MADPLTDDEAALIGQLPSDGSSIPNRVMRERLGWDSDQYWVVRDRLLEAGYLTKGRGRGGLVRAVIQDAPEEEAEVEEVAQQAAVEAAEAVLKEKDLYEPIAAVLSGDWAKDEDLHPLTVEITANQGGKKTGGKFTRPDIVVVEVRTFRYLPKSLEIITFEIKPPSAIDAGAVYEALAHRRAATQSYVVLHVPDHGQAEEDLAIVEAAARDHGIGMIAVQDPSDWETWDTLVRAERYDPDPFLLDEFIDKQLSPKGREAILKNYK